MDGGGTERRARILGITGPIGCGKSTVGNILLRLGALRRIDADDVVHKLMVAGSPLMPAIEGEFGRSVIADDGSVDRARLAAIVFEDQDELRRLERIVHPAVRTAIRQELREYATTPGVFLLDAVKLLQSELLALVDEVWVVQCSPEEELRRLTTTRGMSREEASRRIAAQPLFDSPRVTRVISNDGTEVDLEVAVQRAWEEFLCRAS